jgi:uncharacterized protein with PQ loop repeat
MELIAYIGGILLGVCGVPEVLRTIRDRRCHLGWPFLLMWFFGEAFMLVYSIDLKNSPLIMNYLFNVIIVGIMLYYKIKKQILC